MNYKRIGRFAFAAAGVAAAGAGLWWLKERQTEKPAFTRLDGEGDFELRDYPALLTAETVQAGTRDRALGNGFGVLADYIFANGRDGDEIAMTAPVIAEREDAAHWRVRFVMPTAFTRATLPAPTPGVAVGGLAPRRLAALRFTGTVDDALLARKEHELLDAIAVRGLEGVGPVQHAFYNSPFIPGPMRHNELWREVRVP